MNLLNEMQLNLAMINANLQTNDEHSSNWLNILNNSICDCRFHTKVFNDFAKQISGSASS